MLVELSQVVIVLPVGVEEYPIICFKLRQDILPTAKNDLNIFLLAPTCAKHTFINLRMSLDNSMFHR
uniref:Uncharacterized protein n=1 Tax=Medicago truncatula TaxID=3880 RepID=I3S242_MEDTR|nr:unknown [Medicago truncatula]